MIHEKIPEPCRHCESILVPVNFSIFNTASNLHFYKDDVQIGNIEDLNIKIHLIKDKISTELTYKTTGEPEFKANFDYCPIKFDLTYKYFSISGIDSNISVYYLGTKIGLIQELEFLIKDNRPMIKLASFLI